MRLNERGADYMSTDTNYEQKAITTQIRATSRASVKILNDFYTVEYSEERTVPNVEGVDLEKERKILWDCVNDEVDAQIDTIIKLANQNKLASQR